MEGAEGWRIVPRHNLTYFSIRNINPFDEREREKLAHFAYTNQCLS